MADQKEVPSAELSLKYMAWNIKSIDESLKKIAASLEKFEATGQKHASKVRSEEIPF